MRITTLITTKGKPLWVMRALAHFPFERSAEYPADRRSEMRGTIVSYLKGVTYKRRNATMQLGTTHLIHEYDRLITVETKFQSTIVLAVIFSDKKPVEGTCAICGCNDNTACYNPYYGACWWMGHPHILCSHCACTDIVNASDTYHPDDRQENGAYKISSAKLLEDLKRVKEFHYVKHPE